MFGNMKFEGTAGKLWAAVFFICFGAVLKVNAQQKFDKAVYYKVMEAGNLNEINDEIELIKASTLSENERKAYEGALQMRKAGKVKVPAHKLKVFREGAGKMESAIKHDEDNTEFRFLRLTIQENVPKIVRYRNNIEKDKLHIQKNFKDQPQVVKDAITAYLKISKVLHAEDL